MKVANCVVKERLRRCTGGDVSLDEVSFSRLVRLNGFVL